jgi:hypothetical protein
MATVKSKTKKPIIEANEVVAAPEKSEAPQKSSKKTSIIIETVTETLEQVDVPVVEDVKASGKKQKHAKTKVIRDSFSFPEQDYEKISELKKVCLAAGVHIKKSEILRAGLHLLSALTIEQLKEAVGQVEQVKTGRPKD